LPNTPTSCRAARCCRTSRKPITSSRSLGGDRERYVVQIVAAA
jgi:hypothetical protein